MAGEENSGASAAEEAAALRAGRELVDRELQMAREREEQQRLGMSAEQYREHKLNEQGRKNWDDAVKKGKEIIIKPFQDNRTPEQRAAEENLKIQKENLRAQKLAREDAERRHKETVAAMGKKSTSGGGSGGGSWTPGGNDGPFTYWLFFAVTLILHVYIIRNYKDLGHVGIFSLLYAVVFGVFVMGLFVYMRRHDQDDVRGALGVTCIGLLLYLLPQLVQDVPLIAGNPQLMSAISFIIVYIPAWPVFMMSRIAQHSESSIIHYLFGAYKLVIVLIILFLIAKFLFKLGPQVSAFAGAGVSTNPLEGFWDFTKDRVDDGKGTFTNIREYIDRATDPDSYYTGRIEENAKIPLGVEITSLRPLDERVSNQTPIVVYGTVKTRTFKTESFIGATALLEPTCTVKTKEPIAGAADPPRMDVVWGTSGTFQCTFPAIEKRGSYTVTGAVTFPFETWAYIPITFVDAERARNLARQGLDIATELDIEENPIATYTSGPASLGMGGTPQPLLIDFSAPDIVPKGTRIGITLDNNWQGGESKINSVDWLELKVPFPFALANCDRWKDENGELRADADTAGSVDPNDNLYRTYHFKNPKLDPLTSFTSVTCELTATEDDRLAQWLSTDKATLSFIGAARYSYTLGETTQVSVR